MQGFGEKGGAEATSPLGIFRWGMASLSMVELEIGVEAEEAVASGTSHFG